MRQGSSDVSMTHDDVFMIWKDTGDKTVKTGLKQAEEGAGSHLRMFAALDSNSMTN